MNNMSHVASEATIQQAMFASAAGNQEASQPKKQVSSIAAIIMANLVRLRGKKKVDWVINRLKSSDAYDAYFAEQLLAGGNICHLTSDYALVRTNCTKQCMTVHLEEVVDNE